MRWPSAKQYVLAWRNPEKILRVPGLAGGTVKLDENGLPKAHVGGFGAVFEYTTPDGKRWAIKCFHKKTPGLRRRYRGISSYLSKHDLPYLVKFAWHEKGLQIGEQVLPLVQMPWVEGVCLHKFLGEHHGSPEVCEALFTIWMRLVAQLRASGTAHGDLQHHNILLVPEGHMRYTVKLVDLDGMWLPDLADLPSVETGHRAYQHPYRAREPYHRYLDRFPSLVIALTLAALREDGPDLWAKFHIRRNLIFRALDYMRPNQSRLLAYLRSHPRPEISAMANALAEACRQAPDEIPWVDDLLRQVASPDSTPEALPSNHRPGSDPSQRTAKPGSGPNKPIEPSKPESFAESPWLGAAVGAIFAGMIGLAGVTFGLKWQITTTASLLVLAIATSVPFVLRRNWQMFGGIAPRHVPIAANRQARFVALGLENSLIIREIGKPQPDWVVAAHEKPVTAIAFHPDGMRLATGGADNMVHIWDLATRERVASLRGHNWTIRALAFSPDGRLLASGSGDRTIRLWDVSSASLLSVLKGCDEPVASLAFSPDGSSLASGAADRFWRVWNTETFEETAGRAAHRHEISCLAFATDGYRLATGGDDGLVMLWNLQSGKLIISFPGHKGGVTGLLFTQSGSRIASVGRDGALRVWDIAAKEESASIGLDSMPLTGIAAPDGGNILLVASGAARLFEVDGVRMKFKATRILT